MVVNRNRTLAQWVDASRSGKSAESMRPVPDSRVRPDALTEQAATERTSPTLAGREACRLFRYASAAGSANCAKSASSVNSSDSELMQ